MLGGLGRGSFAPLLAEAVFVDGYTRRVVLHRPAPPSTWPLAAVASPHVVAEEERVVTPQGTFAVSPFVDGRDLDALIAAHPGPRATAEVLAQAIAGLRAADAASVGHGAISGATVRVDRSGTVRLLGFRGERRDDLGELWDLARAAAPALSEALGEAPSTLEEAAARVAALGSPHARALEGPSLAELAAGEAPVALHPHPLSGAELREAPPSPPVPAKVRVAGTAAVTLLLGLLAGLLLGGG